MIKRKHMKQCPASKEKNVQQRSIPTCLASPHVLPVSLVQATRLSTGGNEGVSLRVFSSHLWRTRAPSRHLEHDTGQCSFPPSSKAYCARFDVWLFWGNLALSLACRCCLPSVLCHVELAYFSRRDKKPTRNVPRHTQPPQRHTTPRQSPVPNTTTTHFSRSAMPLLHPYKYTWQKRSPVDNGGKAIDGRNGEAAREKIADSERLCMAPQRKIRRTVPCPRKQSTKFNTRSSETTHLISKLTQWIALFVFGVSTFPSAPMRWRRPSAFWLRKWKPACGLVLGRRFPVHSTLTCGDHGGNETQKLMADYGNTPVAPKPILASCNTRFGAERARETMTIAWKRANYKMLEASVPVIPWECLTFAFRCGISGLLSLLLMEETHQKSHPLQPLCPTRFIFAVPLTRSAVPLSRAAWFHWSSELFLACKGTRRHVQRVVVMKSLFPVAETWAAPHPVYWRCRTPGSGMCWNDSCSRTLMSTTTMRPPGDGRSSGGRNCVIQAASTDKCAGPEGNPRCSEVCRFRRRTRRPVSYLVDGSFPVLWSAFLTSHSQFAPYLGLTASCSTRTWSCDGAFGAQRYPVHRLGTGCQK